jgi:hypothetical protein
LGKLSTSSCAYLRDSRLPGEEHSGLRDSRLPGEEHSGLRDSRLPGEEHSGQTKYYILSKLQRVLSEIKNKTKEERTRGIDVVVAAALRLTRARRGNHESCLRFGSLAHLLGDNMISNKDAHATAKPVRDKKCFQYRLQSYVRLRRKQKADSNHKKNNNNNNIVIINLLQRHHYY